MRLVVIPASRQSDGDLAIMAEFPGVFTTGTQRVGVPGAAERTNGEREILPVDFTEGGKKC